VIFVIVIVIVVVVVIVVVIVDDNSDSDVVVMGRKHPRNLIRIVRNDIPITIITDRVVDIILCDRCYFFCCFPNPRPCPALYVFTVSSLHGSSQIFPHSILFFLFFFPNNNDFFMSRRPKEGIVTDQSWLSPYGVLTLPLLLTDDIQYSRR
jgi:hypothetical protein